MSGEVKVKITLDNKGVGEGLKENADDLKKVGEAAQKSGAAAKPALDSIGMSAKATSAALRGVPAQFTDIVTSLQGGQNPLTVLMQQGGQLKDMFGGIGPAAKALGGYLMGLVNPATIAMGSVGALALAYSQGAEEQEAFARTLIMTGNSAGTTAGQLSVMAARVASSTGATRGMAAETINELLATGKVSVDMLGKVSEAAIDLERVGGSAVAETVKQLTALGDDPVKASIKLNSQMHYLTAEVYEQIKVLTEQGRVTEAAALAQSAYADAIESRIPALANNLGLLQRAWNSVSGAAKGAWDGMLNIGRGESLEQKLDAVNKAIEKAGKPNQIDNGEVGIGTLEKQRAVLLMQIEDQGRMNFRIAEANTDRESGLQQQIKTDELRAKYASKQQLLDKEILAINSSALSVDEKRNAILAARERFSVKTSSAHSKVEDPELDALIARSDEMTRIRKEAEAEIKALESAAKKDRSQQERDQAEQIVGNYNKQFDTTLERIARQNELIGLTERETQVKEALYKVEDDAQRLREELTRQVKDETALKEKLTEVEAGLAEKKLKVAEATRKSYDESRTFESGWADAFAKYKDSASNAADTARTVFSSTTNAMETALKSFAKNGKVDFKSFGDSVINTLIDIQMQSLKTNVLAPMMSSAGGWLSKLFGGSSSSIDTGAGSGFDSALWGVNSQHTGGIVGSDEGSGMRSVSPSVFRNAPRFHTGGIVGDEVPIVAKRGEGVFTQGQMQAMGGSNVTVNVINNASGTKATQSQRSDSSGNKIIDIMLDQVDSAMASNITSGNGKTAAAMEQTYALSRVAGAH